MHDQRVYRTEFRDVAQRDANRLDMADLQHWVEFGGGGGADMFVERAFAHSGDTCIGQRLWDATKSRRSEFDIWPEDLVGLDDFSMSAWIRLPADYGLHIGAIDWGWHEFFCLASENLGASGLFYLRLLLQQPDIGKPIWNLTMGGRTPRAGGEGAQFVWAKTNRFPLRRGEWFHVHYWMTRKASGGAVKVWIDGQLVFDVSGKQTSYGGPLMVTPAKLYFEVAETAACDHSIWLDDLKLYRGCYSYEDAHNPPPITRISTRRTAAEAFAIEGDGFAVGIPSKDLDELGTPVAIKAHIEQQIGRRLPDCYIDQPSIGRFRLVIGNQIETAERAISGRGI